MYKKRYADQELKKNMKQGETEYTALKILQGYDAVEFLSQITRISKCEIKSSIS